MKASSQPPAAEDAVDEPDGEQARQNVDGDRDPDDVDPARDDEGGGDNQCGDDETDDEAVAGPFHFADEVVEVLVLQLNVNIVFADLAQ